MTEVQKCEKKLETKLSQRIKEMKSSKKASSATNPRLDTIDTQNIQPSGSKGNRSVGVHASNTVDSEKDEDSHLLRPSYMNEWSNPSEPFSQNELNLDDTMISKKDSDEDDYH